VEAVELGEAESLEEGLDEVGDGAGVTGLDFAAQDGGDEARESGGEVAGGELRIGEELGELVGELVGELGLFFEGGVIVAEVRVG